jgi:DNA-binding LacI/PurR family transcriptional regulator
MLKKSTTIYDIAEYLKLSPSTISRAINNDVRISNATMAKVRSAMNMLDYVPKPLHQRQGRRVHGIIRNGVKAKKIIFISRSSNSGITHSIMQLVERKLARQGCSFEHLNDSSFSRKKIESADGVILDFMVDDKQLRKILRTKATVEILGHPNMPEIFWDHVTYDNSRVGTIAANYLLAQGHDILAAFYPTNEVARMRSTSFIATALQNKARVKTYPHPEYDFDVELLEQQVEEMNRLKSKPTGLFAFNDLLAVSLHSCLLKVGIVPGKDAEIIACDNDRDILKAINPRPVTIEIHPMQIAKRALEQLFWRFENPYEQPATVIVEPELIKQ